WAAMEPVSGTLQFDEPDDDDSMALPVWKHRSGPGWMVQAFLPIVFCADVAASTVSTVLVDLFLLPGIGLVWCVEESLSHFPEAVPEMEISGQ
ncbi:MAG: hypothetical protein J6Q65_02535, partial [Lentisphaeria bacterium]|nr:hypothetical protein [Lentisphaeria bacterium]